MNVQGSKAQPSPPSGTGHFRWWFRYFGASRLPLVRTPTDPGLATVPRTGPAVLRRAGLSRTTRAPRRAQARPGLAPLLPFLLLASCGSGAGSKDSSAQTDSVLRIAIEAPANALDPRFASDANGSRIAGLIHCSLLEPDRRGGWRPSLATRWSRTTPTTWEFHLRSDARFHDGQRLLLDDVLATYRSVLDPKTASPKRAALASVVAVEKVDTQTLRFVLAQPDAAFLEGATIGILPATLASGPRLPAAGQIGCGPYRVHETNDDRIALTAAETWHGGEVSLPVMEFHVVPDAVMRTLQLKSGHLHLLQNALEPDAVRYLAQQADNLRVSLTPYDAFQYVGINHRHHALSDLRVRRAIAHAIDREGIVRHLLGGQAQLATGMLPPHHDFHTSQLRRYEFDPQRARRLLDEAGWTDPDGEGPKPRLRLRYSTSTVELRRRIAEVVASNLADVGIAISIESYEWGTFFNDIAQGDYDLYSLAWIGIRDPDLLRVVFHSAMTPPSGNNRAFFSNRRIDRLTQRGRTESDPSRRRALYAKVERTVARTLPCIPLWWPNNVVVMSTRLEDFVPHPAGDLTALTRARLRREPNP